MSLPKALQDIGTINTNVDTIETNVDTLETNIDTIEDNIGSFSDIDFVDTFREGCFPWSGAMGAPDVDIMKPGSAVYVVGGRAVYRHSSDMGSVIQWTDKSSVVHKTLVLDALDPTVTSYSGYKLSGWSFDGASSARLWSSSEYSSGSCLAMLYNGGVYDDDRDYIYGVVPVLDL